MPRHAPIEDCYGTELTVQPLMASQGPMVDLEVRGVEEDDSPSRGERLIEAAESHG